MLGWIGKWAHSKGMGKIPDIEGLSLNDARNAILNAGFKLGNETSRGNAEGATSSNNGKAKNRNDVNQLLNYEEVLDFEYYIYVAPPFFPPTFQTPFFPPTFNPPFFPPTFNPPFFPPTFNPPFFPPTFNPPFFPPVFQVVTTGTVYLSYCFNGSPVQESFTVDENNIVVQNINNACSAYNLVLLGLGATDISCSITSMPAAPTNCGPALTTYYWCCCSELDPKVGSFATYEAALNFANELCSGDGEGVCANPSITPVTCGQSPFFPPVFNPPFFPPTFTPTLQTYYFCCDDNTVGTTSASSQNEATNNAEEFCFGISASLTGAVTTTPISSCTGANPFFPPTFAAPNPFFPPTFNPPFFPPTFAAPNPFFPPTFNPPFFPPTFTATIWYCSTTEIGGEGQYRGTWTSDLSSEQCDSYKTVCSIDGYPPYPTVPSCAPSPFFPPYFVPPYFVPPFFPPSFTAPNPFFPPYFVPPYFVPPFFPPYFVPPYFVPPFFPPYFVPPFFPPSFSSNGCTGGCYAPYWNCPTTAPCCGDCFY